MNRYENNVHAVNRGTHNLWRLL